MPGRGAELAIVVSTSRITLILPLHPEDGRGDGNGGDSTSLAFLLCRVSRFHSGDESSPVTASRGASRDLNPPFVSPILMRADVRPPPGIFSKVDGTGEAGEAQRRFNPRRTSRYSRKGFPEGGSAVRESRRLTSRCETGTTLRPFVVALMENHGNSGCTYVLLNLPGVAPSICNVVNVSVKANLVH